MFRVALSGTLNGLKGEPLEALRATLRGSRGAIRGRKRGPLGAFRGERIGCRATWAVFGALLEILFFLFIFLIFFSNKLEPEF